MPCRDAERGSFCSTATKHGKDMVQKLENLAFASWDAFDVHLGEPLLLTACLGPSLPNGAACVACAWTFVEADWVRLQFKDRLRALCKRCDELEIAWRPVTLQTATPRSGGEVKGGVRSIALALLEEFMAPHLKAGMDLMPLPYLGVRTPANNMVHRSLVPEIEMQYILKTRKVAAVRVQLPLVPAAARTSASMLSATVELAGQHVVVHSTSTADTTLDPDAHNAPMYIGITRVSDISDVAVTHDSAVHDNMFEARQPLADLPKEVQRLDKGLGFCSLYHCYAEGHQGGPPGWLGSEEHDGLVKRQAAAGFFSWSQEEEDAVVAAYMAAAAAAV